MPFPHFRTWTSLLLFFFLLALDHIAPRRAEGDRPAGLHQQRPVGLSQPQPGRWETGQHPAGACPSGEGLRRRRPLVSMHVFTEWSYVSLGLLLASEICCPPWTSAHFSLLMQSPNKQASTAWFSSASLFCHFSFFLFSQSLCSCPHATAYHESENSAGLRMGKVKKQVPVVFIWARLLHVFHTICIELWTR